MLTIIAYLMANSSSTKGVLERLSLSSRSIISTVLSSVVLTESKYNSGDPCSEIGCSLASGRPYGTSSHESSKISFHALDSFLKSLLLALQFPHFGIFTLEIVFGKRYACVISSSNGSIRVSMIAVA
jgi:hypothetical protein